MYWHARMFTNKKLVILYARNIVHKKTTSITKKICSSLPYTQQAKKTNSNFCLREANYKILNYYFLEQIFRNCYFHRTTFPVQKDIKNKTKFPFVSRWTGYTQKDHAKKIIGTNMILHLTKDNLYSRKIASLTLINSKLTKHNKCFITCLYRCYIVAESNWLNAFLKLR